MRIFVASWFFPPLTTSEGIVAYKLLSHSEHFYDVCSTRNPKWTYHQETALEAENIAVFPITTDDFNEWLDAAWELFSEHHSKEPYDAIMTRSMPPESILFAKRLRDKGINIPWICSLNDPVGKNPYETADIIDDSSLLSIAEKENLYFALTSGFSSYQGPVNDSIQFLRKRKELEDYAIANATVLVFPHDLLKSFVLDTRMRKNAITVPHTFDTSFYPEATPTESTERTVITYIGHTDARRSLEPLVRAMALLKATNSKAVDKLLLRFVGNVPADVITLVNSYLLQDVISVEPGVDYLTSLKIMQDSDWLLHVDAYFERLEATGGSIFFAGKLADYMGTNAPILALTGHNSPAATIVKRAGGICQQQDDIANISSTLADIASGNLKVTPNSTYRAEYDAQKVAADFDIRCEQLINKKSIPFERPFWPSLPTADVKEKFLTICIPTYNVEPYLDRCLFSLVNSQFANSLEILVINDGSPDNSRNIALAYQERYPGVVQLIDKENGGHGSTINTALRNATGKYFRVIDGDDWVDSKALDTVIEKMLTAKLEPDMVSSNYYQVFATDGHTMPWTKQGDFPDYTLLQFATGDYSKEYFTIHSMMMKTKMLQEANFAIQEHTFYVDVEYTLYPIPYISTIMFTPDFVYRYTVGSAEQSVNYEVFVSRYEQHDRVIRRMLHYFKDAEQLPEAKAKYVNTLFAKHLLRTHYLLSLLLDSDIQRGARRAKDFDEFLRGISPKLWGECGKRYGAVQQARESGFSPEKLRKFKTIETGTHGPPVVTLLRRTAGKVARKAVHTHWGRLMIRTNFGQQMKEQLKNSDLGKA